MFRIDCKLLTFASVNFFIYTAVSVMSISPTQSLIRHAILSHFGASQMVYAWPRYGMLVYDKVNLFEIEPVFFVCSYLLLEVGDSSPPSNHLIFGCLRNSF